MSEMEKESTLDRKKNQLLEEKESNLVSVLIDKIDRLNKENKILRDIIDEEKITDNINLPTGSFSIERLGKIVANYEEIQTRFIKLYLDPNYIRWLSEEITFSLDKARPLTPREFNIVISKELESNFYSLKDVVDAEI